MNVPDFKRYVPFTYLGINVFLTVLIVIFTFYFYISWDKPVEQDPEVLEIKLPVMNWTQYSTLAKQYENGIFNGDLNESDK